MRGFNYDHPHVRSPPGVMSCDEIRYWMRELYTNPAYGWAGHRTALATAMGFHGPNVGRSFGGKLYEPNRGWIYPGEQIRFSRQLRAILAGEIVCKHFSGKGQSARWVAVVADNPTPLKIPPRYVFDFATMKLKRTAAMPPSYMPMLRSFRSFLTPVKSWEPTRVR